MRSWPADRLPTRRLALFSHTMSWKQQLVSAEKAVQQGNFAAAEYMLWEGLKQAEQFGANSPQVLEITECLADVLLQQSKCNEAEDVLLRLAELKTQTQGPTSASTAQTLLKLAELYYSQAKYSRAEPFASNALRVYESIYGKDHAKTAHVAGNIAYIYHAQEKYTQAEELYKRSIAAKTKLLGSNHPEVLDLLKSYATLLEMTHRREEAEHLMRCVHWPVTKTCAVCGFPLEDRDQCLRCTDSTIKAMPTNEKSF